MAALNQTTQSTAASQQLRKKSFRWTPYLFILPHLIFFLAFLAWPFFYGIYISLFSFDFLRPEFRPFVGLQNYAILFDATSIQFLDFWRSMRNTGTFILYSVPPLVIVALVLAVLLNGKFRGNNLFRAIYFAPFALSVTVAAVLWRWIFEQGGLFETLSMQLGLPTIAWLGDMPWPWVAITIATVWWTVGFNTVIFLAALQDIPDSLYEAAALDGASNINQFFSITLPLLRPVLIFVLTTTLLASANLFGQPFIMTAGGPVNQTEPVMMRIYNEGFTQNRMGSAAAMSIFVALILLTLTALNFRIFGQSDENARA